MDKAMKKMLGMNISIETLMLTGNLKDGRLVAKFVVTMLELNKQRGKKWSVIVLAVQT